MRKVPFGKTAIVVELVVALLFVGYLLWSEGVRPPVITDRFELQATFADANGLTASDHAQVTVAGVPLGQVTDVQVEDGQAVATLELDNSVEGRIHEGATAEIASRSALQDLIVDLAAGPSDAPALSEGDRIPATQTAGLVAPDRLVGILDADTRAQTQILVGELGKGLDGRGDELSASLDQLATLVDSSTVVTRTLAERRHLLAQFVGELETIFTRLGERNGQLAGAVDAGERTLAVTAGRDDELAAGIRELPGTMDQLNVALRSVEQLAVPLQPALVDLRPLARRLPGVLQRLRQFAPVGERLVADVQDLARRGAQPVHNLTGVAEQLGPASRSILPTATKALPVLKAIDVNKNGIGEVGDNFSGVFSTNDANGPILRGLGFFEQPRPENLGFPASAGSSANVALATALTQVCLGQNDLACLARFLVPGLPTDLLPGELNLLNGGAATPVQSAAAGKQEGGR